MARQSWEGSQYLFCRRQSWASGVEEHASLALGTAVWLSDEIGRVQGAMAVEDFRCPHTFSPSLGNSARCLHSVPLIVLMNLWGFTFAQG